MPIRSRSTAMTVVRHEGRYLIEYDANIDEVVIRRLGKPAIALSFDKFMEAFERRIQDDMYRPLLEEERAPPGKRPPRRDR